MDRISSDMGVISKTRGSDGLTGDRTRELQSHSTAIIMLIMHFMLFSLFHMSERWTPYNGIRDIRYLLDCEKFISC